MVGSPYTVAAGAGFAGDRVEPAVVLAGSGEVDAVVLECLAERTLVAALRTRQEDGEGGFDPRLRRRLSPLLPVARENGCRVVSNLGAANPAAAGRAIVRLGRELGLDDLRVAVVEGDDVLDRRDRVDWQGSLAGVLLGAHAYLGADGIVEAVDGGAEVVVTGRTADSSLFAGPLISRFALADDALAGALAVGHLLECGGQLTGGNYEPAEGPALDAADLARLGYPLARVSPDGSAEIAVVDGEPGLVNAATCALQLLYEVHDPAAYVTPDATLDFGAVRFEEIGPNRVRMSGARDRGRPERLKVVGFVERPGVIADVEIGFAGRGALERGSRAVDVLRRRLSGWADDDLLIDLVGVNSILGAASPPLAGPPPEVRVHVSAHCADRATAQIVEDEIYALTLSGPAGGAGVRSDRRARVEVVTGFIARDLVPVTVRWEHGA